MNIISSGQNFSAYGIKGGNSLLSNSVSSSNNSSLNAKQGIPLADAIEIDLSQYKLEKFAGTSKLRLPTQDNPQEYQSKLYQQGEVKQTGLIKQNGKIIGTISNKGITAFTNSVGSAIYNAGLSADSSIASIQSFLNKQYGGHITVEEFSPGIGPTYAEVHNSVYKESYDSLIKRQTEEYQREYNNYQGTRLIDTTA